jgi:hypothetical protein
MAAKQLPNLPDLSALDPSVMAALSDGARRQASASLPPQERAKQAKAAAKQRARNRVQIDIDPQVESYLANLATQYGCPLSGLINLALYLIMLDDQAGELDLTPYMVKSNTPRYACVIRLPEPGAQKTNKPPPRGTP